MSCGDWEPDQKPARDYYTTSTGIWPPLAEMMDRSPAEVQATDGLGTACKFGKPTCVQVADSIPSGAETTPQCSKSATDAPSGKAPLLGGDAAVAAAYDPVTRPAHYALDPQPLDVIEAWSLGYHEGNVIKYVARWRDKGGVQDLRKAAEYLRRLIAVAERE